MYEKLFKKLSHKLGIEKTNVSKDQVTLIMSREASQKENGAYLFEKANKFHVPIKLGYFKGHINIVMDIKGKNEHWLYLYDQFLDDLLYNKN
jgi:transcription-repair coupling factor (superfamily II helicase)